MSEQPNTMSEQPNTMSKQPTEYVSVEHAGLLLGLLSEAVDKLRDMGCDDIAERIATQTVKVIKQHQQTK